MHSHGIMFHHFHGGSHAESQGSLDGATLAEMIRFLGPDRILPAREWLNLALAGDLPADALCLTFDDNLRCQYDVALPVLKDAGLTAFWFVPTGTLSGAPDHLEIYRAFRTQHFDEIDDFYEAFFRNLATSQYAPLAEEKLLHFDPSTYLAGYPFYTEADRRFRFVRDDVLGPQRYRQLMDELIATMGVDVAALAASLWMQSQQIRELHDTGHVIGLHSHTHPTRLASLPPEEQAREYRENHTLLASIVGQPITTVAHPCNSYSPETLAILRRLGVQLGFRANLAQTDFSPLEWPREDHANILAAMRAGAATYEPAALAQG